MSSARQMLNVPFDGDDYALLCVKHGSSRAQIIAAAQTRLSAIAAHPNSGTQEALLAQREIREAAQRVVVAEAKTLRKDVIQAPRIQFGSIAAAVLMRRNPRRAHMFLAQMKMDAPASMSHSALPSTTHAPIEIKSAENPERVRRAPWWLATFVTLSVVGLIVEIFVLRSQMQSALSREESKKTDASEVNPIEEPPKSSKPTPAKSALPSTVKESDPAASVPEILSKPALVKPAENTINEPSRLIRNRWQRAARVAIEIPSTELSAASEASGDRLDELVRQAILLERLAALDLVARQLEAGDDRSASLLLETISTEPSVALVALAPRALSPAQEPDGELSKGLERFPGSSLGRTALLRTFRTLPSAPGKLNARTLVQEALKGPSRGSRTIAQAILVDRGFDALNVLEAVEERFAEVSSDPALSGLIRALSGLDPNGLEGAPAARAAIVKKIIMLRGSRVDQLDMAAQDLVTTLRKIAVQMRISAPPKEAAELLRAINPKHSTRRLRMGAWNDEGVLHALVQNGTALLRDQASLLKMRRPADQRIIDQVVTDALVERGQASSALGQAIANARGILAIDAILLGVTGLRDSSVHSTGAPVSLQWDTRFPPEVLARWQSRLEALSLSNPVGFLNLAEEVSDESNDVASRMLARQLYSLAAGLDPESLATSAALGLAALENDQSPEGRAAARRWIAIAQRWSKTPLPRESEIGGGVDSVGSAVRLGVVEALVQYRRGLGRRANDRLKKPEVRAFFDSLMRTVPGGIEEFDRLSAIHVNTVPPPLSDETIDALLRLEHALLRPQSELWSDAVAMGSGGSTFDAPMGTASEIFGVDPARSRWTSNGWVEDDRTNSASPPRE